MPAQARATIGQLRSLPQEEERRLEEYATERVEKLRALSFVSAEIRWHIEPIVRRAARNAHIRENRAATFQQFRSEHRLFRWSLNLVTAFALYWLVAWWALSHSFRKVPQSDQSNSMFLTLVALPCLFFATRTLIGRREGYSSQIHTAVTVFGLTLTLVATHEWWIAQILEVTALPAIQSWQPGTRPVADMAGAVMLERSSIALFRLATLILFLQVGRAVVMAGQTAKSTEYASATLLNSMLEIASQLEALVSKFDRECVSPAEQDAVTAHSYLWLPDRERIIELLETTARFAEGYWGKTTRVVDHVANVEIQRVADGIAASVRRWKSTAAIGGTYPLREMRDAFSIAVVNCAEGDWDLLARDVSEREVFSKRVMRVFRRILALTVLASGVLAILFRPFGWTKGLDSAAAAAPFMVAIAFIAGVLDPTIYDRLTPVTKLGADLLPKR